ncbi:oligosaccharide flippase family protein [Pseudoalteromonas mariniglutinosa]
MYKNIIHSKFVRNVLLVASGAAGAQVLTMIFSPIITRIYGAEVFGVLGVFTAILAVLIPIAALAYPIAIVLPKDDSDAKNIAKLSAYIAAIISFIFFVTILIFGDVLARWLNLQSVSKFLIFIPVALFFAALQQIMQQWLIRKKQFKVTARIAVSQSLILNSAKVGLGFYYPIGAALIIIATLGNALYAVQLWFGARRWSATEDRINSPLTSGKSLKEIIYEYKDFPLYRAPQQLINALSQSLPVLLLASFFGASAAGFYTLAKSIMSVPTLLIGASVGNVFYPRITEASNNNEDLFLLILKATCLLALIGFIPFMFVVIMGPWLFAIVFGNEWIVAGEYARWLSLLMFFMFISRPAISAIPVLKIQGLFLIFEVFSFIGRAGGLFIGFFVFQDDIISVAIFSLVGILVYFILILLVLLKSRSITITGDILHAKL